MTKIKFYLIHFFKNELYVGIVEGLLLIGALVMGILWLVFNKSDLEPYTVILACVGGLVDLTKRLITIPQLPKITFTEAISPSSKEASFFKGVTLTSLEEAIVASRESSKGLFLVIYDREHPTNSGLNYSLGAFTRYELTKRLINDYFIQAIVPSIGLEVQQYIADYHMEQCLLVVLDSKGKILRKEGVYANADEGLKRVREDISKLNNS
jgi:hypothetical protein